MYIYQISFFNEHLILVQAVREFEHIAIVGESDNTVE